ncbi:SDR family NAD(P)-dependent oxidoreductase [Chryseosolibacter indicus]|uniref:SDR family NAD(P)-dependent oxidoreductase n=1 Tax=Chryseosolibacter indicus TaxID=2782351 RepID=A0ABS5VWI0_9BACT|nr:SDR family NAD(P)-dependent oxidoreductase [Chryseosolibacter indicus]MBT1705774.1 SDR family NAD(P)-dependent oxidoreductase [Chryseosolibacter indicus]
MKSVLITGANKSIGFESAIQLLQKGYYVYLGSRTLENGLKAVKDLHAEGLTNVEAIQLDVTNQQSVEAAYKEISLKTAVLDALVNNAGVSGAVPQNALTASIDNFKNVFETNLYGVVRVTQRFIDLLRKSEAPRIVNVSSSVGSLSLQSDPNWPFYQHAKFAVYGPSKSALNMYTVMLAYELRDTAFKVNTIDPGYTKTDFNHHQGTGTVEDAAARVVKYVLIDNNGPTGKYFSEETNPETGLIGW